MIVFPLSLRSLVVERQSCKLKVPGSIPDVGYVFVRDYCIWRMHGWQQAQTRDYNTTRYGRSAWKN